MNSNIIKKIIIEYHDNSQLEILDWYAINQLEGILSVVNESEKQDIINLLNKMEVETMDGWFVCVR